MIKEDYISFETAKLLKEKGFDAKCDSCYAFFADNDIRILNLTHPKSAQLLIKDRYPYVTLQMAMKWLREAHRIDIEVRTHYLNRLKPNDIRYYSGKILKGSEDVIHTIYAKDTYEEVAEDGIRYAAETIMESDGSKSEE